MNHTKWFHINKGVDSHNVLKLNVIDSDFSKFNQMIMRLHLLASLKRLMIVRNKQFNGYNASRLFSRLIKFTALEHLEISLVFEYCDFQHLLVHPNLKVLSIGFVYEEHEFEIEIDCPQLEILQCFAAFDQITVTYPETLKELYYYRFKHLEANITASSSALAAFANVERFWCDSLYMLEEVDIWSMPKLKELRVEDDVEWMGYEEVQWHRDILTDLIDAKKRLGPSRSSAKIYLNDVECSANLKTSHPELFPSDEDSTDDENMEAD